MSFRNRGSRLGTQFGPYELRSLIGVGGMGEVFRAHDTIKGRMVAVKLLRAEYAQHAQALARFLAEAPAPQALSHPASSTSPRSAAQAKGVQIDGGSGAAISIMSGPAHPTDRTFVRERRGRPGWSTTRPRITMLNRKSAGQRAGGSTRRSVSGAGFLGHVAGWGG